MEQELKDFRILSLDGGGSKGVFTLGVLREIESAAGGPLAEHFDLIYGTSTGAIIAALLAMGKSVDEIIEHYFTLIPSVMKYRRASKRTIALEQCVRGILGDARFDSFKTDVGIVVTNYEKEQPMIFKSSVRQAHARKATFEPGFGGTIADALLASAAAYPFFKRRNVTTTNQGSPEVMDGGYVANNPTLFAIADAVNAFGMRRDQIKALSIGVGEYNEPKRSPFHVIYMNRWEIKLINKIFAANTNTIETLRLVLFPDVDCVRINDAFPEPHYATDLLENDPDKLRKLQSLGRDAFAKHEAAVRNLFNWQ